MPLGPVPLLHKCLLLVQVAGRVLGAPPVSPDDFYLTHAKQFS